MKATHVGLYDFGLDDDNPESWDEALDKVQKTYIGYNVIDIWADCAYMGNLWALYDSDGHFDQWIYEAVGA